MASSSGRLDFNILPDSYRRGLFTVHQAAFVTLVVVLLALMVPVYGLVSAGSDEISVLQAENEVVGTQARAVQTKQQALSQLHEETSRYRAVLDKRGMLSDHYLLVTRGLEVPGICVSEVSATSEQMVLVVNADTVQHLWAYEDALNEREEFAGVQVGRYMIRSEETESRYRIEITMAEN